MSTPVASPVPFAEALQRSPIVLDGGLSTELERMGHDVSSALWSARLLRDDPSAVVAAHVAFFEAGAQVATTASYQATFEGFRSAGIEPGEARRLMIRSVELARTAVRDAGVQGDAWVAGSVGPFGAMLADGSEYTGSYADPGWAGRSGGGLSVDELRAFHRPRLEALAEAGCDVLACETIPALAEAEALVAEVQRLGVPAWISITAVRGEDGVARTRQGEPATEFFALARGVDAVVAVGVNCTGPAGLGPVVAEAAEASGGKAVAVYPNSGEVWDAGARRWSGRPGLSAQDVADWLQAGARLVGGCCRIGPSQLRAVADRVQGAA